MGRCGSVDVEFVRIAPGSKTDVVSEFAQEPLSLMAYLLPPAAVSAHTPHVYACDMVAAAVVRVGDNPKIREFWIVHLQLDLDPAEVFCAAIM